MSWQSTSTLKRHTLSTLTVRIDEGTKLINFCKTQRRFNYFEKFENKLTSYIQIERMILKKNDLTKSTKLTIHSKFDDLFKKDDLLKENESTIKKCFEK